MTPTQCKLLEYLTKYIGDHAGEAPTFNMMKDHLGIRSKSGIHRLLTALEERGKIRRLRNRARSIELLERQHALGPQMSARLDEYCRATGEQHVAVITAAFLDYFASHPVPK